MNEFITLRREEAQAELSEDGQNWPAFYSDVAHHASDKLTALGTISTSLWEN
jgi:hypothetical protein